MKNKTDVDVQHGKYFIIKNHIWIPWFLYTIQKEKQKKSFVLNIDPPSCLHGSFFDDSHGQIPGQRESQKLHFGLLHIFLLKTQMCFFKHPADITS